MGTLVLKSVYLLDSVILIDHLRGAEPAVAWTDKLGEGEAVISVVTRTEVLSGGSAEEARPARELCDKFECLPLTKDDATSAADLRRTNGWKLPDAFQAAVALRHVLRLVTRNARDFDEKKHTFVLIPYRLG
jgi:predicted nucleic acid-binding protein